MYQELVEKKIKLAVVGLGYAGLQVALSFAKKFSVIGFDINEEKIQLLNRQVDPGNELSPEAFQQCDIVFTTAESVLSQAGFFVVIVPTPVDKYNVPDLKPLLNASAIIGRVIKKGGYVVYESTTYPGCTEEDCLPVIASVSGLQVNADFKLGYSPERINPGDKNNTLANVVKVVAGSDAAALEQIAKVYECVVHAGVHRAPSIKVAEASKIVENVQRDLNIALMNELSLIFDHIGLNTYEVLEAASTKWNFLPFQPGLVGGHCIGVDTYYLTYKAASLGYSSKVIAASRFINDDMARYVARKVITHVLHNASAPRVLVKGVTFKENVSDIRNSKIIDTVKELLAFNIKVDIEDPCALPAAVKKEYGLQLAATLRNDYDAIIITVPHKAYYLLDDAYFTSISKPAAMVFDLKGIYRGKITSRKYWSL